MQRLTTSLLAALTISTGAAVLASDDGEYYQVPPPEETTTELDAPNGNACKVTFSLGPGAEVHLTGPVCPSASPTNVPGWWDRIRSRFNPQT